MTRKCLGPCGQEKHESDFETYPSGRINAWCKSCAKTKWFGSKVLGSKRGNNTRRK